MLFSCSHKGPRHARADDHGGSFKSSDGSKTHTIDIHCHRQSYPAGELMQVEAEKAGFAALSFGSELTKEVNRKQLDYIKPKMESVDVDFPEDFELAEFIYKKQKGL